MKKIFFSPFKIILILVFIIIASRFYSNHQHISSLREEISYKESQVLLAEKRRQALLDELENINNPDFIEKIARQELGLVKPGEMLIIPVEESK
ncbi:FtsB family cell division protein [Natronospora cellulosivora (SeqCode)]